MLVDEASLVKFMGCSTNDNCFCPHQRSLTIWFSLVLTTYDRGPSRRRVYDIIKNVLYTP